jgi:ABC-type transport system involved in multi-copper enzyme maturation permease subunit
MNGRAFVALISREWRTSWADRGAYILRAVYAGMLLVGAAAAWLLLPWLFEAKRGDFPELLRSTFGLLCRVQFVLATVVASVTFARAVTREQERGSMDLLILSPLSRTEILLGKLAGEFSGLTALVASGLPAMFLLLPLGGLGLLDILSLQGLVLAQMLAVGGFCIALASALGRGLPVMLATWLLVGVWAGGAQLSRSASWRALSPYHLLECQLASVRPDPAAAVKALLVAAATGAVCCVLGGLVLERRLATETRIGRWSRLATWIRRRIRWAPERRVFQFLLPSTHPLMCRECTLAGSLPLVFLWLVFLSAYGLAMLSKSGASVDWHVALSLIALAIGVGAAVLTGALAVGLDRRRGTMQALLAAGVAPEDIVRAHFAGLLLRAVLFVAPPAVHALISGAMLADFTTNSLYWRIPAAVAGLMIGVIVMMGITLKCGLSNRRPEVAIVVALLFAPPIGALAGSMVAGTPVTLALGLPLMIAAILSGFAYVVRKLPKWVLS